MVTWYRMCAKVGAFFGGGLGLVNGYIDGISAGKKDGENEVSQQVLGVGYGLHQGLVGSCLGALAGLSLFTPCFALLANWRLGNIDFSKFPEREKNVWFVPPIMFFQPTVFESPILPVVIPPPSTITTSPELV